MKIFFLITIILFTYSASWSQYLAAFNDNLDQFWVFEAGMFNQLEHYEIEEFQVGGTLIAYLDHASNFKIYQYGKVDTLMKVAQVKFTATDYLLGYSLFDTLYVYDDEKIKTLSTDCEAYLVRDSIIIWQTISEGNLQIYYQGEISTIAEDLPDFKFKSYMAGDNLFAFVNSITSEFTVFYQGEVFVLDSYAEGMKYQAGSDILAYNNTRDQSFKVFYKGEDKELDVYQPKSFQVGDQIMAYVNNQDELLFYKNDKIKSITDEPAFYEVKDHVLVYEEQGSFKTVCNDQNYTLEQYIPEPHYLDVNTIAWLENDESIRVFQHCEIITANKINVLKFNMVRDVIVFAEDEYKIKVYFNGKVYEHQPN